MVQQLPAIVIGGPPHAGKSVLLYNLTQALYERGVRHHAIRACPDGEGNWFQEGNADTVSLIRDTNKSHWSSDFISRMSSDLERRCLPFLVDMGGNPRITELPLFQQCTHAVLLLRADKPNSTRVWESMVTEANLRTFAHLYSQLEGISTITARTPFLEGTITGLERQSQTVRHNPVFNELVEQIATLFSSYSSQDIERVFLQKAPTEIVLNLPDELKAFTTTSILWEPEMLAPFLQRIPKDTPLSVHGWGPNWLYAALATHAGQQPFYLFDPKLSGWVQPLRVNIGEPVVQAQSDEHPPEIVIEKREAQNATVLSIKFPTGRLTYYQADALTFPSVSLECGLIFDGPLPYWLLTAIMRLYQQAGVAWIAPHHAQQNKDGQKQTAIVTYSRAATHHVGDLLDIPGE